MKKLKTPKILKKSPILNAIIAVVLILVILVVSAFSWYTSQLAAVNSSQTAKLFVIQEGVTVTEIASNLQSAKLIKNAWAFEAYVKVQGLSTKFKAGTYALAPDQSAGSIAKTLTKGKVTSVLVTILPGKRIDQIRAELINDGFTPDEVDHALDPDQYSNLPIMAIKPPQVITLEGLLWPDSFEKDQTTTASDIIKESLIEAGEKITPDVETQFANQGLTPYQGLTLSSVIEQEVSNPNDQTEVAQVFYTRLKKGVMLGSDVTARYGAISAGLEPSLTYDSPYNTLIHTGLPPTPISTIDKNALFAATHPASTNWLFFVTGDDGVTHFTSTLEEHEAATAKYCHKLCSL